MYIPVFTMYIHWSKPKFQEPNLHRAHLPRIASQSNRSSMDFMFK